MARPRRKQSKGTCPPEADAPAGLSHPRRPTWDEYFLRITREVAQRSTCLRRQVGALLVLDKRI
ncbi:MAG: hypothetical protein ACK4WF_06060, partial [Candidatus Brocadiales bacterium]